VHPDSTAKWMFS